MMVRWVIAVLVLALCASPTWADRRPRKPTPTAKAKKAPRPPRPPARESAPQPQPTKPQLSQQDAEILMSFFNMFVDVVLAAKGDCSAIAANVNMLMDHNAELIRKIREAKLGGFEFPKPMMDKMMVRVKDLMPALQKCISDPDVEAAFARFDGKQAERVEQPAID